MMKAWEYRDGDIVEVTPLPHQGYAHPPFEGVIDSRRRTPGRSAFTRATEWVWVRKGDYPYSGGWYPSQVRLIRRPKPEPALPLPALIELGEE